MPYKDSEKQKQSKHEYYLRTKEKTLASNRARRRAAQEYIYDYLLLHPCTDCGEDDPMVMHFDHLRDKDQEVCRLMHSGCNLDRLQKEIDKCEVVCANCHMRRTAKRGNYFRYRSAS